MFGDADLKNKLNQVRNKTRKGDGNLVSEARKILKQDLLTDKNILQNLPLYQSSFHALDEEDLDSEDVFTLKEVKRIAVIYRLKFLEHTLFKPELPYEAILKINSLNERFHKEITEFKILSPYENFRKPKGKFKNHSYL